MPPTDTTAAPTRFSAAWINSLVTVPPERPATRQKRERRSPRYPYSGAQALIEVPTRGQVPEQHPVVTRDLSREGSCFIVIKFFYPGATISLNLRTIDGGWRTIPAEVVRCRYLPGTPMLHEVGVLFNTPIQVDLFHHAARSKRVVILDPNGGTTAFVTRLLRHHHTSLHRAETVEDMIAATEDEQFDMALFDGDVCEPEGAASFRTATGGAIPMLGLVSAGHADAVAPLRASGCAATLNKPFNADQLTSLIDAHLREQLISTLADDPELHEPVNEFVLGLPERMSQLRYLRAMEEVEDSCKLVRKLRSDAGMYGFPPLAHAAACVLENLLARADAATLHNSVAELIATCHAIRLAGNQTAG